MLDRLHDMQVTSSGPQEVPLPGIRFILVLCFILVIYILYIILGFLLAAAMAGHMHASARLTCQGLHTCFLASC